MKKSAVLMMLLFSSFSFAQKTSATLGERSHVGGTDTFCFAEMQSTCDSCFRQCAMQYSGEIREKLNKEYNKKHNIKSNTSTADDI